jgi:hypothetical protein
MVAALYKVFTGAGKSLRAFTRGAFLNGNVEETRN